ncbi:MAG: hypothetical protein ABJN36_03240 [Cyclobacteriaceae bacterium]
MLMYYYLLFRISQFIANQRAILLIFLLQGLVSFTVLKVLLCELVGYEEYVRFFREGIIVIPCTIVFLLLAVVDNSFFKKMEERKVYEKWGNERGIIKWVKIALILIANVVVFLYFDDMMNHFRHYW